MEKVFTMKDASWRELGVIPSLGVFSQESSPAWMSLKGWG